ncbi:MAG: S9 family peptidase [Armatimonadetes bacterium]|nr:S9 family peptidase [Armatimonadota bacterium]
MADWRERFHLPCFPWSEIARRRPERGVLVHGKDLMAWDVPSGRLRLLVHRPHGVVLFAINRSIDPLGRFILYLEDCGGNEIGHLARVPWQGGEPVDLTPGLPPYTVVGLGMSLDGRRIVLNPVLADGFQLYVLDPEPQPGAAPRCLYRAEREFIRSIPSSDGSLVSVMSTEWTGLRHYGLVVLSADSGERIAQLWDGQDSNFWHGCFCPLPGDPRLLASGLRGERRQPLVWDVATGERRWLETEHLGSEVAPLDWSLDGSTVLLSRFADGTQTLFRYRLAEDRCDPVPHEPGAFGEYGGTYSRFVYFGPGDTVIAHRQTSTRPLRLEAYADGRPAEVWFDAAAPSARPWSSVFFPSSDGTRVQAWLGRPQGPGPFPAVISLHGGPHLVLTEAFCPGGQCWMDHGFVFLSPNFRGSTTFGAGFQEQIWGQLGRWELEDLVAARDFLVREGLADPGAVFLSGESYGGFLTLWGLGRRPDLWAGGMAAVALTDWTATYEDASSALRGAFRAWFGGSPDEVPERYRESSPIHLVEQIRAPVLLFQGLNDSRTPPRQARLFEERMRAAGKAIEVEWFEGGHAMDAQRKVRVQERMLEFARQLLKR